MTYSGSNKVSIVDDCNGTNKCRCTHSSYDEAYIMSSTQTQIPPMGIVLQQAGF